MKLGYILKFDFRQSNHLRVVDRFLMKSRFLEFFFCTCCPDTLHSIEGDLLGSLIDALVKTLFIQRTGEKTLIGFD